MNKPKQPIRLVALDMDGTVLLDNKTISPRVLKAIADAAQQGVMVVPATGRAADGVPDAFYKAANSCYAITANGARVVDLQTGESLVESLIPQDMALQAYDMLQGYDCVADLFQDGKGYSTAANMELHERLLPKNVLQYVKGSRILVEDLRAFVKTQPQGVEKWTMFFASEEERLDAWAKLETLGFEVVSSLPRNMELSAPGVSKGWALSHLTKLLCLSAEEVMACGDGGNDLTMIEAAGLGVAMENATEDVKAAAQFITATNQEDGVAVAIEQFVLA